MKKIFILMFVFISLTTGMVSCNNTQKDTINNCDSLEIASDTMATDSSECFEAVYCVD